MPAPVSFSKVGRSVSPTWCSNCRCLSTFRRPGLSIISTSSCLPGSRKDTWVQAAEVRPTDRAVVHHIIAFVREPQSNWFKGQKAGEYFLLLRK